MFANILGALFLLFLSIYISIAVSSWMLANRIRDLYLVRSHCYYVPYFYFRVLFKSIFKCKNVKKRLKFMLNVQQSILFILYVIQEVCEKEEIEKEAITAASQEDRAAACKKGLAPNVAAISYSKLCKVY